MFSCDPGVSLGEDLEGGVDELGVGLRVLDLVELLHALLVGDALGLEPRHQLRLQLRDLWRRIGTRVLEDRLDQAQHVEGVVGLLGVEHLQRLDQVERQGLVEREVALQVFAHANRAASALGSPRQLDDPGLPQRAEEHRRLAAQAPLSLRRPRGSARSAPPASGSHLPCSTATTMPWLTWKRERRVSGGRSTSCSKVSRFQLTKPRVGAFFLTGFLLSARRAPFSAMRLFSITCSGAWHTTLPRSSKPLRPARPAICLKSRDAEDAAPSRRRTCRAW